MTYRIKIIKGKDGVGHPFYTYQIFKGDKRIRLVSLIYRMYQAESTAKRNAAKQIYKELFL